ncbi:hypothetical protein [Streptomyces sp. CC224B]|uniref:hypothetical protein n=1 Tax=Streptomyces sp. CC224B TaxID=3044571 RepID=UPI0024A7DB78|nr:hypothetical protein [Streptomyces sp. CC224B]
MTNAFGWGAPVIGQLCHLALTRYQAECQLYAVYDDAFPCGVDLPRLWHKALEELESHC